MEILRLTLLDVHFIGLAAIIGPFLFQLRRRTGLDLGTMLVGAVVQVVSGMGLIGARRFEGLPVIDEKMAVKLAIALVVLAAVIIARRRSSKADGGGLVWFRSAGILAIANVAVAAVWI